MRYEWRNDLRVTGRLNEIKAGMHTVVNDFQTVDAVLLLQV